MNHASRIIELREYQPLELPADALSEKEASLLEQEYPAKIQIDPPSFRNNHRWRLLSQGWVGFIPLTPNLAFHLQPKAPLRTLFGMWEYAYNLKSFRFLDGLTEVETLEEAYEQLANIFAKRVLNRARQGFYRSYVPRQEKLLYLRGRLDTHQVIRRPWDVRLPCQFEEHTADIEDNQILTYTLWRIAQSGICTERVLPLVRRAYRSLQGLTTFQPFSPASCINRRYHRLNQDYQPLHALSRFFLDHSGPTHQSGDRPISPFLVDMARLFEAFVAAWMEAHLPGDWLVQSQEALYFGKEHRQKFQIDLVLRRIGANAPTIVLDTKYKIPDEPATEDISQVVSYAEGLGSTEAVLVYPAPLKYPLDANIGKIHVRTVIFSLDDDLDKAGQAFLSSLGINSSR